MASDDVWAVGAIAACCGALFWHGFLKGCGLLRSRAEHFRWRKREGLPTPSGWEDDEE
jgi:hypothetical protein